MALARDPDEDPGLARERTRLAWARTAIAFAALGVALLRRDIPAGVLTLAMTPLVWGLGRYVAPVTRTGPLSRRLLLVTVIVTGVSALAIAVALLGHSPDSLRQLLPSRH